MIKIKPGKYRGAIQIPPSKSDSQRAILCAALANGKSILKNIGSSHDEMAMLQTIQILGAKVIQTTGSQIEIYGIESSEKLKSLQIDCGESGLGLRLITPVSTYFSENVMITGQGSLRSRKMEFFQAYFPQMGIDIKLNDNKLPIRLSGNFHPGNYEVDGSESSQYISGLLMALVLNNHNNILKVNNLASADYVKMTLKTLQEFGIRITESNETYSILAGQDYKPATYTIDGDWSSASCWLVASALGADISVKGLSMSSLQADKAILKAFIESGCRINQDENGISINGTMRKPLNFDATDCPDLFPALAVYAAFTIGVSSIKGIHRLENKESNRAKSIQSEFQKLGIEVKLENNEMIISGITTVKETVVESHNDHRIAMALATIGLVSNTPISITNPEAVSKSYPAFWNHLNKLVHF